MSEASQFVILAVPLLLLFAVAARALYARRNEPASAPAKTRALEPSETPSAAHDQPAAPLPGWARELLVMLAIVLVVIAGGAFWFFNLLSHTPY